MSEPVLSVRGLTVEFETPDGIVHAVTDTSFDVYPGETWGLVGESGCGKTVSVLALLGLLPRPPGRIVSGEAWFGGRDLLRSSAKELRRIRGREIGMVFQDPTTSLNPVFTVGRQITEAIRVHDPQVSKVRARDRAAELLEAVGVPNGRGRLDDHPHRWSGGMRQRAMIAMAIANRPRLLIADEPTTALDVTIQAQVLDILRVAQRETGAATILITHDLGVVAEMADRLGVMYAGRIVETGESRALFRQPRHPYTVGLLASLPRLQVDPARLVPIRGQPPNLFQVPSGCAFHPRCSLMQGRQRCREVVPDLVQADGPGRRAACHYHDEVPRLLERTVG